MTKRIVWLDNLKAVAIILVVVRHVMQANIADCSQTVVGNAIFAVQMPMFMIISGYFSITSARYYHNRKEVRRYIGKRLIHYMLPFFSWYILVYVLLRGFYGRNIFQAIDVLINNIDVGLWFLYVVFVLSAVCILANMICYKLKIYSKTGLVSVFMGGGILFPLLILGRFNGMRFIGINLLLYYYLYFSLGYLLFYNRKIIKTIVESKIVLMFLNIIAGIVFCIIVFNYNIEQAPDSVIGICIRVIAALSGCTVIAIFVYCLSFKNRSNKWFCIVGQNTLEIYVVHLHYIGLLPKGTHYLYTLDGAVTFFIALVITALMTAITIIGIKKVSVLNYIFFGKRSK